MVHERMTSIDDFIKVEKCKVKISISKRYYV
jgi:hypothetical protein